MARLPNWMRGIPHPLYGNYGGRPRKCRGEVCPMPVDGMDNLFRKHDSDLYIANHMSNEEERKMYQKQADHDLAIGLRKYKGPYANKLYGPMYRRMAMLVFRP